MKSPTSLNSFHILKNNLKAQRNSESSSFTKWTLFPAFHQTASVPASDHISHA